MIWLWFWYQNYPLLHPVDRSILLTPCTPGRVPPGHYSTSRTTYPCRMLFHRHFASSSSFVPSIIPLFQELWRMPPSLKMNRQSCTVATRILLRSQMNDHQNWSVCRSVWAWELVEVLTSNICQDTKVLVPFTIKCLATVSRETKQGGNCILWTKMKLEVTRLYD